MNDGFFQQVHEAVRLIPRGKVASYGQIAALVGRPRSARYVGYALRANPLPAAGSAGDADVIPCHRVVFKDGSVTDGFAFGGPGEQRRLLEEEGVRFTPSGRVDMAACRWNDPLGV